MKEARLSIRIDNMSSSEIDHYVATGKYSSRSAFGLEAVNRLLQVERRGESDRSILLKIVENLVIANSHPAHSIPPKLINEFKIMMRDREGMGL